MLALWRLGAVAPLRMRALTAATRSTTASLLPKILSSHPPRRLLSTAARDDVRMYNSLTGELEPLPRSSAVTPHVLRWYACGPTVYDRAHLGHARAYVSQDIMRRVLEKRFGYNVFLVMGVTDVDDKIIQRAQERNVSFTALARDEEQSFMADMAALHVQPPTALTRVSEHMDEIIAYIQQIEANGFAYAAPDGSGVYFHTQQLGDAYGKLDPAARSSIDEPSPPPPPPPASFKRNIRDFALWKTAKALDEPAWDSPWGRGRPGWHIECSAMTHHVLGATLDVHTGGIDLRFPHHNNEIAQCEAHRSSRCCCDGHSTGEWCRHFVHFGHLYIDGLKMSKSLKNFVSVADFLAVSTADHWRLFCLQFKYRSNLHYAHDRVRDAAVIADKLANFFQTLQNCDTTTNQNEWTSAKCDADDVALLTDVFETRAAVDAALANDLDTPRALSLILQLVAKTHAYVLHQQRRDDDKRPHNDVLRAVAVFVLEQLELFGVDGLYQTFVHVPALFDPHNSHSAEAIGETTATDGLGANGDAVLDALVQFRAAVRAAALLDPRASHNREILALCDALRNDALPRLGVLVEDLAPGKSVFKLRTNAASDDDAIASDERSEAQTTHQVKQQALDALLQLAPHELFRQAPEFAGMYSAFDADGVPTLDAQKPPVLVTKSQRKKLMKRLEKHTKAYNKYWAAKQQQQ